jgi:Ca2+-binding EF-hand superfamily protein
MSGGFLALQAKKSRERKKLVDLEDAFKDADTNKDGKLSVDEWADVLAKAGHDNPR